MLNWLLKFSIHWEIIFATGSVPTLIQWYYIIRVAGFVGNVSSQDRNFMSQFGIFELRFVISIENTSRIIYFHSCSSHRIPHFVLLCFSRWKWCRSPFFSSGFQLQEQNDRSPHKVTRGNRNRNQCSLLTWEFLSFSVRNWDPLEKNDQRHRFQREKYF